MVAASCDTVEAVPDEPSVRNGKLKIELPFEDAIKAALETPPEPEDVRPFGKRKAKVARQRPDRQLRSQGK
jgi:hypothetical protein